MSTSRLPAKASRAGARPFGTSAEGERAARPADVPHAGGDRAALRDIARALNANIARGYLESEEQLRQITEAMDEVVALSDEATGQLLFVNLAYELIWGRSREELYARPMVFLQGVHPDDRERVREAFATPQTSEFSLEYRVVTPAGELRWVSTRGFPVRDAAGTIYRRVSITEDISERKRIAASHQRLLRGFTHDVKNPLGAAQGYLSLLEEAVFGELTPQQIEAIRHARRSIHAALDLVAQLLEIERAEAGELSIDRSLVDIAIVTWNIVEDFRGAANAKGLKLDLLPARAEDTLAVETDRARVHQILANLVSNAVKYTQPGGCITVRAHVADDAEAPRPGRWIAVSVADNGPGIPIDKQKALFREFTRFSPNAAEGSGVGLAISQQMATALGGTITVTSAPGEGSTFILWVPTLSRSTDSGAAAD